MLLRNSSSSASSHFESLALYIVDLVVITWDTFSDPIRYLIRYPNSAILYCEQNHQFSVESNIHSYNVVEVLGKMSSGARLLIPVDTGAVECWLKNSPR